MSQPLKVVSSLNVLESPRVRVKPDPKHLHPQPSLSLHHAGAVSKAIASMGSKHCLHPEYQPKVQPKALNK